jgi:hypothetical protein
LRGFRQGSRGNPKFFKKYFSTKSEIATPSAPQKARNDKKGGIASLLTMTAL